MFNVVNVDQPPETREQPQKVLTEQDKQKILSSTDFQDFFDVSSKIMERVLNGHDSVVDYRQENMVETVNENELQKKQVFYNEKLCKNRLVTSMDWSKRYQELSLASYTSHNGQGQVLVWNAHLSSSRPEFTFTAQTDVLVAKFSPFSPHLIVGGAKSGQILIWDTRQKSIPVLKTPLTTSGHTHPVYSISVVGTLNAHNILSASTDGTVCAWQMDMLVKPQETLALEQPVPNSRNDEISITCMSFPPNETGMFLVGTEEGLIYQTLRYDRAGSKAGINPKSIYSRHESVITGLCHHPATGPVDYDVFLTSSMDWTVKLWKTSQPNEPLKTFEGWNDYVYDVKWSPKHPSVFATGDGSGNLSLFDLNQDYESPVQTIKASTNAINKIEWDVDGKRIALGTDSKVVVYEVPKRYQQPATEDYGRFAKVLSEYEKFYLV